MALYHLHAKIIKRSDGKSAVGAAAYRSAERLTNEYDGITHDYRNKKYVEDAVVLLPENAPAEFADRSILWNAVEQTEKQSTAQLAREIEFALPVELSPEERKQIALEYVQEQFVSRGMIADVCFHKQHTKQNPDGSIEANPHCHVMLTLRPIDESGKWEPKNSTLYLCEKNGEQKLLSSAEIKADKSWEKLYSYKTADNKTLWMTKSRAEEIGSDKLTLVNKYPKRENVQNPKMKEWNSTETLLEWRRAWAEKQNLYFEEHGIEAQVDHRSYKEQGVDFIPTVHEGKDVTAIERKLQKEYEQKVAHGETAVLQHTEIRDLNIAIREHNKELRIIAEMKKLRAKLEKMIEAVKERAESIAQSIAERLERLRADIIKLGMRIRATVTAKAQDDEKIQQNQAYIKDIAPVRKERLEELRQERKTLKKQLDTTTGLFSGKRREELQEKLDRLDDEIDLQKENRKYALTAQKEIDQLKQVSEKAGEQIELMQEQRIEKMSEYTETEAQIAEDHAEFIRQERLMLRPMIEEEDVAKDEKRDFMREAEKFDQKMKCSVSDLAYTQELEGHEMTMKPTIS